MTTDDDRRLLFERTLRAPRAAVWRCWTEPRLLEGWFCPRPWRVEGAELDVRPGGIMRTPMRGPAGEAANDEPGVFLEVEPGRRLVFTDAFGPGWIPSGKAFMVADVVFEDAAGGTLYRAAVRHWSEEDRKAHEDMGFRRGWDAAADQLEALAASLG